jgi:hypothetical protein
MPRYAGKIKNKVVRTTLNNQDVLDLFHGVLGTGEGTELNLEIVYPKYRKIMEHCERFVRLLEVFRDTAVMSNFPHEADHLTDYVSALRADLAFPVPDLAALHPPGPHDLAADKLIAYSAVTLDEYNAFAAAYKKIKTSSAVNTIVVTCKNLVGHRKSLEDPAALNDRFLLRSGGLVVAPLPNLPALNFKQIYGSDMLGPEDRRFVLMVLHKLYKISHDVYDVMSSPDIDVNEFIQVIMASLDDVKKHIPRCSEAFDLIASSVNLLQNNFDDYYKDYVASNNPTIIMENFVLDVSQKAKSSPRIAGQFRRIITHYRKLAAQQASNPKLQSLFQQVDKNFQELEKKVRGGEDDESGDESPESVEPSEDSIPKTGAV